MDGRFVCVDKWWRSVVVDWWLVRLRFREVGGVLRGVWM